MEKFKVVEADEENKIELEQTDHATATTEDEEKVSVEKIKKLQFVMIAEQLFLYSAFFDFLEKYAANLMKQCGEDVETGEVAAAEPWPEPATGFDLWSRIYNAENGTYFGKKSKEWIDLAAWIFFVVTVLTSAGAVFYLLMETRNKG